ncbi:MAG: hypothetical protein J3Q66DRAFT_420192 [Benniella sp.]|nr:MAG: hypothetical protein J3Q66DRAFT_420192 [Benniella sp.]
MQAANFISFLDLSPEGRILWVSPGVYETLGYEPDELVGMRGYDILYPEDHSETALQYSTQTLYREFERLKRHHEVFANTWDHRLMELEARVCLILNRFARSLTVMYASSACEKVFHVHPDDITGKPILLFIRADDLASFVEQVDVIKRSASILQIRFWFQSPKWPREIPCEAVILGTDDGIVAIVRRCRPFVRKHFIESKEQYETHSRGSSQSSRSFHRNQPYSSSPCSEVSTSPSSYGSYGIKSGTPPRDLPRTTLNQIRILELDDARPQSYSERKATLEASGLREVIVQHYDEEGDEDDDDDIDTVVRGVAVSRLDDGDVGI